MSSNKKAAKAEEVDSDEEQVVEEEESPEEAGEDTSLANPEVLIKYQEAAKIVNLVLAEVASLCVAGTPILNICVAGENSIQEKVNAIFKGKNKSGKSIDKGAAFPVCVSVNEFVCHYTPFASEDRLPPLVDGDVVKIDLGVHIDGYIAVGAHTVVVGHAPNPEAPIVGPRANAIHAAWAAAEVAANLISAGNTNTEVSAAMRAIAEAYNVRAITGTVMHEMKRYVIDGKKNVLLRTDGDERVEACTFETGEIFSIDIAFSSGEGKPRPSELRTTVFKRQVEKKYGLKVKASRVFFNDVNKRFPTLPFTARHFDEGSAKLGLRECITHELLASYPVLVERAGDQVAHVKFTVLLLPTGTVKITGLERPEGFACPDVVLPEPLQAILTAAATKAARKKNKKDKAKKAAAEATA